MKKVLPAALALFLAAFPLTAHAAGLEVGMKAPEFEAESTMGPVRLIDYLGKKNVLLAVYYKDFTGG
jgi:hypothetical protein